MINITPEEALAVSVIVTAIEDFIVAVEEGYLDESGRETEKAVTGRDRVRSREIIENGIDAARFLKGNGEVKEFWCRAVGVDSAGLWDMAKKARRLRGEK